MDQLNKFFSTFVIDKFSLESVAYHGVPVTYKNIAWKSDRETKFKNPKGFPGVLNAYAKPKYWFNKLNEISNDTDNNGMINQDFIVWMRVAAFPTFRKLWRILDRNSPQATNFKSGLPFGEYKLTIDYSMFSISFFFSILKKAILNDLSFIYCSKF